MPPPFFPYKEGLLHCDHVPISHILSLYPTPLYCYAQQALVHNATLFQQAISALPQKSLVCYAVKANGHIALLHILKRMGWGADIVSYGEMQRALKAGIAPEHIVFSGVGKTYDELAHAARHGIRQINIESQEELDDIENVVRHHPPPHSIRCALRVNPDIQAPTHAKISTGNKHDKFGIQPDLIPTLAQRIHTHPALTFTGLAIHIGSQIRDARAFEPAFQCLKTLATALQQNAIPVPSLDLGGGLDICPPHNDTKRHFQTYAQSVHNILKTYQGTLIFEPGRSIIGNTAILIARVIRHKRQKHRNILIIDAAMNDLIRPALYHSEHPLLLAQEKHDEQPILTDVVGPICESSDMFNKNLMLPPLKAQDAVAIAHAGAYGAAMASSYNARPLCQEILVDGTHIHTISQPYTAEDAMRRETTPPSHNNVIQ
ncbi:MAG: diaminopimelate decarboxylase [Alphaproteobacteria bacterium GM7ARS4]|nr:diaminopimelate decarboxylase [Alphaproteobacteria bacterium GM7ARS4]